MKNSTSIKLLREFGFVFGIGLPLLIGLILPALFGHSVRVWTIWVGSPIFLLAIISPKTLDLPYKVWMKIGQVLGFINSHLILGLVFAFVLQPIAFIMRLSGYDPLLKKKKIKYSYRETRKTSNIDLTRIF